MKPADMRILQLIRQNARMNLTTMSRKTGIPVSTIFDRLRSQEGQSISRFTALLDFARLGYPIRITMLLKAAPQHRGPLCSYLLSHDRVNNLWRINNGYDYAADCVFTSIREAEEFMEQLESKFTIVGRHVHHIIEDIVREKLMSEEEPYRMRE